MTANTAAYSPLPPPCSEVLSLLHSLTLTELDIVAKIQQHFISLSHFEKLDFVPSLAMYCQSHAAAFTHLVCLCFRECLRAAPGEFVTAFKPHLVYSLLNEPKDRWSDEIGVFLLELATVKLSLGLNFQAETLKLVCELSRGQRLSAAPVSPLRHLVLRVWQDFPSTRPRHFSLSRLLLQWLSICPPGCAEISAILRLLRSLQKEGDRHLFDMTLLFDFLQLLLQNRICQSSSQLVLVLVNYADHVLLPILQLFSVAQLFTIWTLLASFPPFIPAVCGVQLSQNLFRGTPYPLVAFQYSLLTSCLKLVGSVPNFSTEQLAESCLRVVLAKGCSPLLRPDAELLLKYLLDDAVPFREGPSLLVSFPQLARVHQAGLHCWSAVSITLPPGPLDLGRDRADVHSVAFTDHLFGPVLSEEQDSSTSRLALVRVPPPGIQNFNNTCFIASVMQAFLASASPFVDALFLAPEDANVAIGSWQLAVARLLVTQHAFVEISDFLRTLPAHFRSGEQQDTSEAARFLLSELATPSMRSLFSGELVQTIECLVCGRKSDRVETFTDLLLTVSGGQSGQSIVSLQDLLLADLLKPELLQGDNQYTCDSGVCGGRKCDARKYTTVTSAGEYVILVLNRFAFDPATGDFKKQLTPVAILDGCTLAGHHFLPYAVVIHSGPSVNEGHYTAAVSHPSCWWLLDDTDVNPIAPDQLQHTLAGLRKATDSVYMVFLRRASPESSLASAPATVAVRTTLVQQATAVELAAVHL